MFQGPSSGLSGLHCRERRLAIYSSVAPFVSLYALRSELPAGKMRLAPLARHVSICPGDTEFLAGIHSGSPDQPAIFCPSGARQRDPEVGVDRVALRIGAHDGLVYDGVLQGPRPRRSPRGVGTRLGSLWRLHPDRDLVCVVAGVARRLRSCPRKTRAEPHKVAAGSLCIYVSQQQYTATVPSYPCLLSDARPRTPVF